MIAFGTLAHRSIFMNIAAISRHGILYGGFGDAVQPPTLRLIHWWTGGGVSDVCGLHEIIEGIHPQEFGNAGAAPNDSRAHLDRLNRAGAFAR